MSTLNDIPHIDLTAKRLDQIIRIKSSAWPYSYDKQIYWIKSNVKDSDLHLILSNNQGEATAYMNLIDIEIRIDTTPLPAFGIGNVCAIERGKGWGKELLLKTNDYLVKCRKIGLLFCKDSLVKFYSENKWKQVTLYYDSNDLKIDAKAMIFNVINGFSKIEYCGKPF